ncbi:hypothetical protein F5Y08DRAFT_319175 [Xylaria arbuscula]|nr:hypothetical protein F5Y08DRAFT_319175 [Xylaria arbuscula]
MRQHHTTPLAKRGNWSRCVTRKIPLRTRSLFFSWLVTLVDAVSFHNDKAEYKDTVDSKCRVPTCQVHLVCVEGQIAAHLYTRNNVFIYLNIRMNIPGRPKGETLGGGSLSRK